MADLMRRVARKVTPKVFRLCESLGFHIQPVWYLSPIAETEELTDELFEYQSECVGLDWNSQVQGHYLSEIFPRYAGEVGFDQNTGLSLVDGAILHAMIRHHKPRKIVEIGSGSSTQIAARSCLMNQEDGHDCELVAIEPNPKPYLKEGFPGLTKLIDQKVQAVDMSEIVDCDLLFIDSSHVIRIGGDVNYEILELVPRLKPGALIHWHDIFLPGEYWKSWVKEDHNFLTEQYLLHGFLKFNSEFEMLWASRYMHLKEAQAIQTVFPFFEPSKHQISSCWIRRVD